MRLKTTELTATFFEFISSSNHLKCIDDLEPYLMWGLICWDGVDWMCQSGSVLPCFAEMSARGKISEKHNSVLRAQPLERPPQTLEFAEAVFKAVLCYDPSKKCALITIVTIIISISIVIMNQQPFKKCYKSQAKDWSPFLNPPVGDFTTLSFHTFSAPSGGNEWFRLFRASGATKNSQRRKSWGVTDEVTAQYQCGWKVSGEMVVFQLVIRERVMAKFYARIIRV